MKFFQLPSNIKGFRYNLLYLAIALLSIIVLFKNIQITYAYTDSYEFLLNAGNDNFLSVFIMHGRILYGGLCKILFQTFNSLEHIKYIRFISLTGGIMFILVLFTVLKSVYRDKFWALLTTLMYATSPAFCIIIIWSATFQVSWALLGSFIAGYLAFKRQTNYGYLFASLILGIISLNLYQPAYTMSIIPAFVFWIKDQKNERLIVPFILHIITYILYFIIYKVYLSHFGLSIIQRGGVDYNLVNNVLWFFDEPFEQALGLNFIFSPTSLRGLVRVIVLVAIGFVFIRNTRRHQHQYQRVALNVIILFIFLFLSVLPNSITVDKWVSYRTMNTLMLMVSIFISTASFEIFHGKRKFLTLLLILPLYFSANYNVNEGFINIQADELNASRNAIQRELKNSPDMIYYIPPKMDLLVENGRFERVVTDEFGRLSSSSEWVPEPMFKLILENNIAVVVSKFDSTTSAKSKVVIDIGREFLIQRSK